MAKIYINLEVKIFKLEKKTFIYRNFFFLCGNCKKNPMAYQPVLVRII